MNNLELIVTERINTMDLHIFCDTINKLEIHGVKIYQKGRFNFNKFRRECIEISKYLSRNDIPVDGIRYELCNFLSLIQRITGIRNYAKFLSDD